MLCTKLREASSLRYEIIKMNILDLVFGNLKKTANILFSKYVFASILATLISTVVLWFFVDVMGFLAVIINPIVSIFLFFLKFFLYRRTEMFSRKGHNLTKYTLVWAFLVTLSTISIYVLVDLMKFWVVPVNLFLSVAIFLMRFAIYRNLNMLTTYKEKNIAGNYYDKHNSKNPAVRFIMKQFHSNLAGLIKKSGCKEMLDIGCGEGYTTLEMKRRVPYLKILGMDIEKHIVDIAKNQETEDVKFSVGSAYSIEKPNNSYCLVLATEILEHLDEPDKAIEEIKRVSSKYCIFSVPNEPFFRMANLARLSYLDRLGNTPGHVQNWTKWKFKKMLKKHFSNVEVKTSSLWNLAICKND